MNLWAKTEYTRTVVIVLVTLMIVWELAVRLLHVKAFILPAPSSVFQDIFSHPQFYFQESLYTIYVTMVGFALAVVFGVALAIAIVSSKFLERTLYTLLVALNSVPKVALAPLFVIWLGTGGAPKIAIAALIAVFPIVINTTLGLRAIDPEMIDLARSARATKRHIMMKIRFPNALPSIFAGAKVGISFALIGAIVGEFVAGEFGLGYVILTSQSTFNTPRAFGAILLLGVIGTVMFFIVDLCERWLLPWHVSRRDAEAI
ncbi:MAG: ABC transporter permease [Xanthobacteraceae bacterium]